MTISLPLDQMSVEEKLQVMEAIWDDLSQHPDEMQSQAWHGKVLKAMEEAVARGEETFDDWETAKRRIRDDLAWGGSRFPPRRKSNFRQATIFTNASPKDWGITFLTH